ncbi:MAG: radical SAM protein [Deltaproteobacteria bacterium]|nr:radical SAM protein [Deltaproteobacteria bacterium]
MLITRNQSLLFSDPDAIIGGVLGEPFRKYRRNFRLAERGKAFPFPLHLDLDLTTRCNLKCPVCPAGNPSRSIFPGLGRDMDPSLYEAALKEASRHALPSLRLGMTGEPLLLKEIPQYASLAAAYGVLDVSLVTNGRLLTGDLSLALIKSGLTRLMVSVDAWTEADYARRRPGGSFRRLLNNLDDFLRARAELKSPLPVLRLSFVDRGLDAKEKREILEFFAETADYLVFQKYQNLTGEGGEGDGASGDFYCGEPFARLALHADGGLFPCCSDYGRIAPVGFFPETSLREAWNSPQAALARSQGKEGRLHPSCAACRGLESAGEIYPYSKRSLPKEGKDLSAGA